MSITKANFFSYQSFNLTEKDLESVCSSDFRLHNPKDKMASFSFEAARVISLPWRFNIRLMAYAIQPLPGENKDQVAWGVVKRIGCIALANLMLPVSVVSFLFSFPFHLYSHSQRPMIGCIHNPKATGIPTSEPDQIHVRTHNLGFVYEFLRIIGDLREVTTRAAEIGEWINEDKKLPEVICFQEAFHIDGTKILCDELSKKYPYVIHSIAPHVLGLNNGGVIASMYPIKAFSFRPFENLLGPEKWSTRGLLHMTVEKNGKRVDLYSTHTQALLGKERCEERRAEIQQIVEWMEEDKQNGADLQILEGDFNCSRLTAWGELNEEDDESFKILSDNFSEPFLKDHDEWGNRTQGQPQFSEDGLPEPTGTWYLGPLAERGKLISALDWLNNASPKKMVSPPPKDHGWGTKEWSSKQHLCTARFDYIFRKRDGVYNNDHAEIRRIKAKPETQSASSDHAPVDGLIDIS